MSIRAFYNEIDLYCCAWLSNLMDAGLITPGVICDKSIEDVLPDELLGFDRVHMFAGIGVWDFALNQAGWGGQVWTGSCPCQPFSSAGAGAGFEDPRHLWPTFAWLIKQCKPAVVFGEQVASKAVEPWVDLVHADMEAMDYAFGAVPFPSAGVGAPHIRDRLYWVADRNFDRFNKSNALLLGGEQGKAGSHTPRSLPWADLERVECPDGKVRLRKPGLSLLADGNSGQLGQIRAYGNAINAEAAAVFIETFLESK